MTRQFDNVIGTVAWAYIILCLDINIVRVNLLPDWVAYMMIFYALPYIAEKQRSALLLKNFVMALGILNGTGWLANIFGIEISLYFISIFSTTIHLYTHFQLLTNLADIATEENRVYSKTLTKGRNVAMVAYTATVITNRFVPLGTVVYAPAAVNLLAQVYLIYQLFLYSAELSDEQNSTIIENMEV